MIGFRPFPHSTLEFHARPYLGRSLSPSATAIRSANPDEETIGGDAAILYCFVFLYLVFAGPGPWSIDRLRER
jgi:uncharacterized membrane protein YphA (DoxX/SURF4 family)